MLASLKVVQIALGGAAGFALCWLIHMVILSGVEAKQRAALVAQETRLQAECAADKAITEEANEYYQQQVGDITIKLDKYRMYASKCVAISADATKLSASRREHAGQNGLTVDWLRSYAAECRTYQAQRMTCDKYFDGIRK